MEIETVFMSCFSIEKKPDDIFTLIEAALQVGASKYPTQFEKRKNRIIKFLMNPSVTSNAFILDDDEKEEEVTNVEEKEESENKKQIHTQNNKPLMKKIEVAIKKTVQVASLKKKNNNAITATMELKKTSETDLVQQQSDVADNTSMGSRKRRTSMNMSTKRVEVAPREKQLCSFKKQLQKQSVNTEKKTEEGSQQTPTHRRSFVNTKSMSPPLPLMKMNVATKPVDVAHQNQQLSDCSPQKQSNNCSDKKKFESSKRKFEDRLAEEREAKRRIVMVDFHQMPKPANDPRVPKRCWDRKRF